MSQHKEMNLQRYVRGCAPAEISTAKPGKSPALFLVHPEELLMMESPAQTSHCGHSPSGSLELVLGRGPGRWSSIPQPSVISVTDQSKVISLSCQSNISKVTGILRPVVLASPPSALVGLVFLVLLCSRREQSHCMWPGSEKWASWGQKGASHLRDNNTFVINFIQYAWLYLYPCGSLFFLSLSWINNMTIPSDAEG